MSVCLFLVLSTLSGCFVLFFFLFLFTLLILKEFYDCMFSARIFSLDLIAWTLGIPGKNMFLGLGN